VTAPPRNSTTLTALLLIGLASLIRTKMQQQPTRSVEEAIAPYGQTRAAPTPPQEPILPEAQEPLPEAPKPPKQERRGRRRLGKILIVVGVVLMAYSAAVIFWGDPATNLYTRWKQHQLTAELDKEFAAYAAAADPAPITEEQPRAATPKELAKMSRERVEAAANRMNGKLKMSHALGRIKAPRLGLNAVFVQGTRWGPDLSKGPGHYAQTSLPGVGRTVGIAAHRTTFGAWFRQIDSFRAGDSIALQLPYGTFHYRVFGHKIVDDGDWKIIRDRGFDLLVLSACHPLYSASHRWIVFAALYQVDPVKGTPYLVNRRNQVRPLGS
jgi:sortase A